MKTIRAVFFDVDGVLLDSLGPHLRICEDIQRERGLGLRVPSEVEFRAMLRSGVRISPMERMFAAVGFPEEAAKEADREYQKVFMDRYAPPPFPEIGAMLAALAEAHLQLGYVTANVRRNVERPLGELASYFEPRCRYSKDDPEAATKESALRKAAATLGLEQREMLYVGDLWSDFEAAESAGTRFLGVTYGWGITREDVAFPTADSPAAVAQYALERAV